MRNPIKLDLKKEMAGQGNKIKKKMKKKLTIILINVIIFLLV